MIQVVEGCSISWKVKLCNSVLRLVMVLSWQVAGLSCWCHSGVTGGCYAIAKAMNRQAASLYQSYLLRLWRDTPQSTWRASLQSAATEELRHFATIEELWAFLIAQMEGKDDDRGATRPDATTQPKGTRETHE